MENETIRKKLVIGMTRRRDWEEKLSSFLHELIEIFKLELADEERIFICRLPTIFANLIYPEILDSFRVEFDGEGLEIDVVYDPEEEEEDDLDLSVLSVIDWEIQSVRICLVTDDPEYARKIIGQRLEEPLSQRINVHLEDISGPDPELIEEEAEQDNDAETNQNVEEEL